MSLQDQINQDLTRALKERDELTLSTLRLLKSAVKNTAIAQGKELNDPDIVGIVQREIKQRRDSVAQYRQADRQDLADKEEKEAAILQRYLPPQLSDEELTAIIQNAIAQTQATDPKDTGKVMAAVMPIVKGKTDGTRVAALVQEKLRHG